MAEKSVTMKTAENLARFFLRHHEIVSVYLFGSTAMWEDGDDVDLILETANSGLSLRFLRGLNRAVELMNGIRQVHLEAGIHWGEEEYGALKVIREGLAFSLLQWDVWKQECNRLCWNEKFPEWNACFAQKPVRAYEALLLEKNYFRPLDVFLFPVGWQTDETVRTLLPSFASRRLWARFPFHAVLRWQARAYNPSSGTFDPRVQLPELEETQYLRARRYAKMVWTRGRNKEQKELEMQRPK